jgi:NADH:ubiquinone oxidoreductase subunit 5 (subunit L)/multisubunit Na+/H+ antiporter MnhA subunit
MDKLLTSLESLMPGKVPKAILGLTIVIAGYLYIQAPSLPTVQPPLSTTETLALQIWQSSLALALGLLALVVSLVVQFNKTKSSLQSLERMLLQVMRLSDGMKNLSKDRMAYLQLKDPSTYTKETIAEVNNLVEYRHSIEKISAIILRHLDEHKVVFQPEDRERQG